MLVINNAKFTTEMEDVLRELKGKTFKSIECYKTTPDSVYGKCRLNLGTFAVDLYNYIHTMPFFGVQEDIPLFTCERMDKKSIFEPCEQGKTAHVYMIDEKITGVEVVNDLINVNHGEYEISLDQALIIRTKYNVYSFYKGWMYSELINISSDRRDTIVYDLDKVEYDWSGRGVDPIEVVRTTRIL